MPCDGRSHKVTSLVLVDGRRRPVEGQPDRTKAVLRLSKPMVQSKWRKPIIAGVRAERVMASRILALV